MLSKKFITAILILFIGAAAQLILGEFFGFWINFALAALVAVAFFLELIQLAFLALLAVFLLNSRPAFSYELLFVAALPFLVLKLRELLPWHRWLSCGFFVFLGIAAMYAIFAPGIFVSDIQIFLIDALSAVIFGTVAFKTMKII
ncbi:MAG: hypothetical protein AAB897_02910 [Patescibacteria group bacterium]